MSISKTVAFGLAALTLSAMSAQAAPRHAAHHPMHMKKHGMAHHRGGMMRGSSGMGDADRSADSLNAQSLSRAQGAQ